MTWDTWWNTAWYLCVVGIPCVTFHRVNFCISQPHSWVHRDLACMDSPPPLLLHDLGVSFILDPLVGGWWPLTLIPTLGRGLLIGKIIFLKCVNTWFPQILSLLLEVQTTCSARAGRYIICCGVQVHYSNPELTPVAILSPSPVRPPAFLPSHPNTTQGTSKSSWWWLLRILVTKKIHAGNRNCSWGFYFF